MKNLTIGQLAKEAQVNVETVRYYERRGLLPEPPRRESGYRLYFPNDVARLRFIKHAKELGFSLREILELLALRVDANTTCGDVKKRAEAKIADIEEKIQALQEIKQALTTLAALCSGSGPTSECPILEALNASNNLKPKTSNEGDYEV
jgi:MerR family mercuric resistance operon transcriptional regulator